MIPGDEIHQMHDRELDAWRESTKTCFQGERLSQGKNELYDFNVALE
jgi:hypothetical protein